MVYILASSQSISTQYCKFFSMLKWVNIKSNNLAEHKVFSSPERMHAHEETVLESSGAEQALLQPVSCITFWMYDL